MPPTFAPDNALASAVYDAAKIAHEAVAKLGMNDGPTLIAAATLIRAVLGVQDSAETREAALERLDTMNEHLASIAGSLVSAVAELGKIREEVARIAPGRESRR